MPADLLQPADSSSFQTLLPEHEQKELPALREFLAAEVAPGSTRPGPRRTSRTTSSRALAEADIVGRSYDWGGRPRASRLFTGFQAMELSRVDPSMATFLGVGDEHPDRRSLDHRTEHLPPAAARLTRPGDAARRRGAVPVTR